MRWEKYNGDIHMIKLLKALKCSIWCRLKLGNSVGISQYVRYNSHVDYDNQWLQCVNCGRKINITDNGWGTGI